MVSLGAFKTTFFILSFYMPAEAPQSINSPESLYLAPQLSMHSKRFP